jgi:integrase
MKKAWIYRRKGVKGWWVGWYERGKRKTKALPSKALAEHFRKIKYAQLNSDVFTGTISVDWKKMLDEYLHSKKVAGYVEDSIYEAALSLRHFERIIGKCNSKQITQSAIDKYILERGKEVIRSTLNKDIRNMRAFVRWCRKNRYVNGEIEIKELKEDERPVKSLSNTQIKKLLSASKRHKTLRMRILLALSTGLRLGDIDSIMVSDINFENSSITTRSKKTIKSMGSRPVSVPIMTELKKYVYGLDTKQEKLFNDYFSRYTWTKIRRKLGLEDLKFHDLRNYADTFIMPSRFAFS